MQLLQPTFLARTSSPGKSFPQFLWLQLLQPHFPARFSSLPQSTPPLPLQLLLLQPLLSSFPAQPSQPQSTPPLLLLPPLRPVSPAQSSFCQQHTCHQPMLLPQPSTSLSSLWLWLQLMPTICPSGPLTHLQDVPQLRQPLAENSQSPQLANLMWLTCPPQPSFELQSTSPWLLFLHRKQAFPPEKLQGASQPLLLQPQWSAAPP
mmetsp:Transcript_81773/g.150477  ORF Transcript_81773/g.150477 Transcript_81773/m.150477 type:complete len:205 (-) Transcript_81773:416-1030(-)